MKPEKLNKIISFHDIAKLYDFEPVDTKIGSNEKRKKCPNDNSLLLKIKIEDIILDYCPECFGIWFDKNELDQILNKNIQREELLSNVEVNDTFDKSLKECPDCKNKLFKKNIESIITLDFCKNCRGIWLDGGEFSLLYHSRRSKNINNVLFSIINDCNVDIYI